MLLLSNEEVERLITIGECMDALEPMYRDLGEGRALHLPRVDHLMPTAHSGAYYAFKHMGGGWPRKAILALRINSDIVTHPEADGKVRRVKIPAANGRWVGLVQLYDIDSGALLAMFPDGVAQRLRVGATNGLGVKYMAAQDARQAALIGSGWQAGTQLAALLAARPAEQVRVFSPNQDNRNRFAAEANRVFEADIEAADTLQDCVKDADIILSATSSLVRVIEPHWLRPGVHVSCIKCQEVDEAVIRKCHRVVMHTKLQAKQADCVLPGTEHVPDAHLQGWWQRQETAPGRFPDLADLVCARSPGREDAAETTCFVNNIGLGLQFAAVGALILEKAAEAGAGRHLPDEWFSEDVHP